MTGRSRQVLVASAIVAAALAALYIYNLEPPSRLDGQERRETMQCLRQTLMDLSFASYKKPDGGACTSLQQAVNWVNSEYHGNLSNYWRIMTYDSNRLVHPNPDWNKWQKAATNDNLYANELAVFCVPPVSTNKMGNMFLGMRFDFEFVELTNPPPWPAVVEWLEEKHGGK
jgi:hypothetical protein